MANKTSALHIVIVGAGLGGLAAAYCLAHHGHKVELYERKEAFSPTGGGIQIRPGASRVLHQWGLADAFEKVSERTAATVYRSSATNEVVFRRVPGSYSAYPDWGTTRRLALAIFYEHAIEAGAGAHFGETVVSLSDDANTATVELKSGNVIKADLVLIADGILSRLRSDVLGEADAARELSLAAQTGHQVKVSEEQMSSNIEASKLTDTTDLTGWAGDNKYVVGRWSGKTKMFNAIFFIPAQDYDNPRLWDEVGDIDIVRKTFQQFPPSLRAVLAMAKACDRWRIAESPNYTRWISNHGRLALLGDSAHGMLPDLAQGFSQIVEDIGVLNDLLADDRAASIPEATKIWQDIRKPRAERVKAAARANHDNYTKNGFSLPKSASAPTTQAVVPQDTGDIQPDPDAPINSPAFLKWLFDYDSKAEIDKFFNS